MKTSGSIAYNVIIGLLLFLSPAVTAQPDTPIWKFARTASSGDILFMLTDTIGNTYLAGTFDKANFRYGDDSVPGIQGTQTLNTFILKTDPTGRLVWLHSAHGEVLDTKIRPTKMNLSNRGELVVALQAENSNNVLLNDILLPADSRQLIPILAKFSKTGNIDWAYSLLCDKDTLPEIQVNDLFIDELGDVYSTGYFRGDFAHLFDRTIPGLFDYDMLFIARINSRGDIIWFRNCSYNSEQADASIRGTRIKNTSSDYFYLGGRHEGYRSFYFGNDSIFSSQSIDCFLARYRKTDGQPEWAKAFRGDSLDYIEDIVITGDNSVIASALYNSSILYVEGNTSRERIM